MDHVPSSADDLNQALSSDSGDQHDFHDDSDATPAQSGKGESHQSATHASAHNDPSTPDAFHQGVGDRPHPSTMPPGTPAQPAAENFWVELRNILVLSVFLAFGIRTFVAEARYIPSESMLPTLEVNDRLIVEKVSYRFREPRRGDVVVFRPTDAIRKANPNFNDALIKRIIGLPGETVEVKDGRVYIDGEALVESYIEEAPDYPWGPQIIPEDSYLVLGDNRNNSYDSHFWGFVPDENLIGRAAVRVWPPDRLGALNEEPLFYFEEIPSESDSEASE